MLAQGARFLARREEGVGWVPATDEQRRAQRPGSEKPSERGPVSVNHTLSLFGRSNSWRLCTRRVEKTVALAKTGRALDIVLATDEPYP